jgi:hypothetical protein
MASDDDPVAMHFLAGPTNQVHRHFRPERERPGRSKFEAILPNADVVRRESELCPIFLQAERLENPRGV